MKEAIQVAAVGKNEDGDPTALFSNLKPHFDYYGIGSDVWSFKAGGGFQVMSGTSMACAHITGFVTAISCEGNKIANSKLNASLRADFSLDLSLSTNCKNSPNISFLTFLDEEECDAVWRGKLNIYYLSKALDEVSRLQKQVSQLG
jgi:hypothetical protein